MHSGNILCDRSLPDAVIIHALHSAFEGLDTRIIQGKPIETEEAEPDQVYWSTSALQGDYNLKLSLHYTQQQYILDFIQHVARFCSAANCQALIEDDREHAHTMILMRPPWEPVHITLNAQQLAQQTIIIDSNGLIQYGSFLIDHWLGNRAIQTGLAKVLGIHPSELTLRNIQTTHGNTGLLVDIEPYSDDEFVLQIDLWQRSGIRWTPKTTAHEQWLFAVRQFCAMHQCKGKLISTSD